MMSIFLHHLCVNHSLDATKGLHPPKIDICYFLHCLILGDAKFDVVVNLLYPVLEKSPIYTAEVKQLTCQKINIVSKISVQIQLLTMKVCEVKLLIRSTKGLECPSERSQKEVS